MSGHSYRRSSKSGDCRYDGDYRGIRDNAGILLDLFGYLHKKNIVSPLKAALSLRPEKHFEKIFGRPGGCCPV